jgi:hypothetical protein
MWFAAVMMTSERELKAYPFGSFAASARHNLANRLVIIGGIRSAGLLSWPAMGMDLGCRYTRNSHRRVRRSKRCAGGHAGAARDRGGEPCSSGYRGRANHRGIANYRRPNRHGDRERGAG